MPNRPPQQKDLTKEPVWARYAVMDPGEDGTFIIHPFPVKLPNEATAVNFYEELQALYSRLAYELATKPKESK